MRLKNREERLICPIVPEGSAPGRIPAAAGKIKTRSEREAENRTWRCLNDIVFYLLI